MIVFYDANCPLCSTEMLKLKQADMHNQISLEDINATDFETRFKYIKREEARSYLHGQQSSGEMLYGLDVTFAAWDLVGKHSWLKVFKLPGIRFIADLAYWLFAKYRMPISACYAKLMPHSACQQCKK